MQESNGRKMNDKPKILITFRTGGENGGPYVSHKRIMESALSDKYCFKALMVPHIRSLRNPAVLYKFSKQIKKESPALVHFAGLQLEGFFVMLACRLAGVKTVLAVHGSSTEAEGFEGFKKSVIKKLERYTVKKATVSYGVSDYVSGWEICKKSKNYFGTIYNISLPEMGKKVPEVSVREELGISKDDIVIVSTGRIIKDKGYDVLWDVIKKGGRKKSVKFIIAGDGSYKKELEREILESEYNNDVFLLGYRSDIDGILSESDIFIICTKHETLCISLLEAAVKHLPLVATNVGGIPEIIDDTCGFLIEKNDVSGFAQALDKLISDPSLRISMGNNAYQKVINKFSEERILKKLDGLYQSVISGK